MAFLPHLSPRVILMVGAVGAVVMAFAGYQLGRPPERLQITLAAAHPVDVKSKVTAAKTPTASVFRTGETHPVQTFQAPTLERESRSVAPAPSRNEERATQARLQTGADIVVKPATHGRPVHPLSMTPTWPLALKAVDFETLGVPAPMQAAIQKLQDQFVKEVGGLNQNPADAAYGQRWLNATQRADDLLRAQIGWEAFNAYSLATMHASGAAK